VTGQNTLDSVRAVVADRMRLDKRLPSSWRRWAIDLLAK